MSRATWDMGLHDGRCVHGMQFDKKKERGTKGPGWGCGCAELVHGMLAHGHGHGGVHGGQEASCQYLGKPTEPQAARQISGLVHIFQQQCLPKLTEATCRPAL